MFKKVKKSNQAMVKDTDTAAETAEFIEIQVTKMPLKKRFITKSTTDQAEITESIPDKPKSKLDYLH